MTVWRYEIMGSPLGDIHLIAQDDTLCMLEFDGDEKRMRRLIGQRFGQNEIESGAAPAAISEAIAAYFEGEFDALNAIPTKTNGTDFQERVWRALRDIPPGSTTSYGVLAKRLGAPGASRAVGMANGANPVAVVIPCHRVIGADGSLTGYGGGLDKKRWLLAHEGIAPWRQGELTL
jgi:methylated-DNA-[protein]-cysteine S-methyltransferase